MNFKSLLAAALGVSTVAATMAGMADKASAAQNGGPGSYCSIGTDYQTQQIPQCTCPPNSLKYYFQPPDQPYPGYGLPAFYNCYVPNAIVRWPVGGLGVVVGKLNPARLGDHSLVLQLTVQKGTIVNLSLSDAQAEELIQVVQRGLALAKASAARPDKPAMSEKPLAPAPKGK